MSVCLFVTAGVDDHANGEVLLEFIDLILGLKGIILLLEGFCALLFRGLRVVEVVLGVF